MQACSVINAGLMGQGFAADEVIRHLPVQTPCTVAQSLGCDQNCSTQLVHFTGPLWCLLMAYIVRRQSIYYLNLRLPKHLFPSRHTLRISLQVIPVQTAQSYFLDWRTDHPHPMQSPAGGGAGNINLGSCVSGSVRSAQSSNRGPVGCIANRREKLPYSLHLS